MERTSGWDVPARAQRLDDARGLLGLDGEQIGIACRGIIEGCVAADPLRIERGAACGIGLDDVDG